MKTRIYLGRRRCLILPHGMKLKHKFQKGYRKTCRGGGAYPFTETSAIRAFIRSIIGERQTKPEVKKEAQAKPTFRPSHISEGGNR